MTEQASNKKKASTPNAAKASEKRSRARASAPPAGHLDPGHAARLLRIARETASTDVDVAFVAGPRSRDSIAEQLGEETVASMTSGESTVADSWDERVAEEDGGPFVETTADEEFATGTDESNIAGATREPFPKTSATR